MKNKERLPLNTWFMGKDELALLIFGEDAEEALITKPRKILLQEDEYQLYTLFKGIPGVQIYKKDQITVDENNHIVITGDPVYSHYYTNKMEENNESLELFIEEFIRDWELTKDEIESLPKKKHQELLPVISIITYSKEDKEIPEHPILEEARKGVWLTEKNIVAESLFGENTKHSSKPIYLKINPDTIEITFTKKPAIKRTYEKAAIEFKVEDNSLYLKQTGPYEDEVIVDEKNLSVPTDNMSFPFIFVS